MTEPRFGEEVRRNGLGEDPNPRLARYVAACREVAAETGVPLVDHFGAWEKAQAAGQRLQAWTTDGVHPNVAGNAEIAARLAEALTPLVRALTPP